MATEIELKAWVSDPPGLRAKLANLAAFRGTFEKNDIFFIRPGSDLPNPGPQNPPAIAGNPCYGVRIRQETFTGLDGIAKQVILVTQKSKVIQNGIEVNDEREFEVSSSPVFEEFLTFLGFIERIRKRKKGSSYENDGMTVELTEVEGLGWFIELEILMPVNDEQKIEHEKEKLLCFLDRLEIPRESIESRSYTSMLAEKPEA